MSIKTIRQKTGLSQRAFAKKYNLGLRNLQNWEQGISPPPKYLITLLSRAVAVDFNIKIEKEGVDSNE